MSFCCNIFVYINNFGEYMITGELKNKIDDIWNAFWSGGITNPLTVVEQITYLMFIHDLGEMDDRELSMSRRFNYPYESKFTGEDEREIDGKKITFPEKNINGAALFYRMQKPSIILWYMVYFHLLKICIKKIIITTPNI